MPNGPNTVACELWFTTTTRPMDPKMGIGLTPYGYSPNGLSALYRLKKQKQDKTVQH